jgi:hypothetical protein
MTYMSSLFFGMGCPDASKNSIKAIPDVHNESFNDKYLGLPTDVGRSKNGAYNYLKDGKVGWRRPSQLVVRKSD